MPRTINQGPDLRGEPQGIVGEESSLPLMALAAMASSGGSDANSEVNAYMLELLREEAAKRRRNQEKRDKLALAAAQASKEWMENREREESTCSHRNQANRTRLRGQKLSNGQFSLVCTFCNANFFFPAHQGQKEVPKDLWPTADEIGL